MPPQKEQLGLVGGRWVTGKGGISRWVGPAPTDRVHSIVPHTHAETAELVLPVLESLARLTQHTGGTKPGWLCECGCLLIGDETVCYACMVWAESDVVKHSWQAEERNNRVA